MIAWPFSPVILSISSARKPFITLITMTSMATLSMTTPMLIAGDQRDHRLAAPGQHVALGDGPFEGGEDQDLGAFQAASRCM